LLQNLLDLCFLSTVPQELKLYKSNKKIKMENHEEKSEEQIICSKYMIKYSQTTTGYNPLWVCRMCFAFILSEDAVREHLTRCNVPSDAESD
jgi:hypothetical protein